MKQAISAIFIAVLGALTLVQAQQTPPVGNVRSQSHKRPGFATSAWV